MIKNQKLFVPWVSFVSKFLYPKNIPNCEILVYSTKPNNVRLKLQIIVHLCTNIWTISDTKSYIIRQNSYKLYIISLIWSMA